MNGLRKCVVAIARNENDYIEEWLKHYIGLGFRKAVVFDNNDMPGLKSAVNKFGLGDFCEVNEKYVGVRSFVQCRAYLDTFNRLRHEFDWFGFFDIDEFVDADVSLDEFLSDARYRGFDEIRLHWRIFGDCGLVRRDSRPVVERFKTPLPLEFNENRECKSFVRGSCAPYKFSCHGAAGVRACDTLGRPCECFMEKNAGPATWHMARVNHYRTKTIEEFARCKLGRGDDWNKYSNKLSEFYKINERTPEKDAVVAEIAAHGRTPTPTATPTPTLRDRAIAFTKGYVHGDFIGNPRTIQEKIAHIKLFGIKPEMTRCADKLQVKDYAREKLGVDICVPVIAVYRSGDEIDFSRLPERFALKCNHGSHYNIIVGDKSRLDKAWAVGQIKKWLSEDYALKGYELQYHEIPRRAFAEKHVGGNNGNEAVDYKFICFNGVPAYCQVVSGAGTRNAVLNYYDMDFKFVDICRLDYIRNNRSVMHQRPKSFELMREYASRLSEPFDFVRVDFFELDGKPYLGELTFTPANARQRYAGDPGTGLMIGNMLRITK